LSGYSSRNFDDWFPNLFFHIIYDYAQYEIDDLREQFYYWKGKFIIIYGILEC